MHARSTTRLSRLDPDTADGIVDYHAVGDPGGFGNVSCERLRRDLRYLTDRYDVVDLPAVLERGDRPRVALTFDDGYQNFYEKVFPVLQALEIPATLFVPVAFVGGGPERFQYRFARSPSASDRFNYASGHAVTDVTDVEFLSGINSARSLQATSSP